MADSPNHPSAVVRQLVPWVLIISVLVVYASAPWEILVTLSVGYVRLMVGRR